MSDSIPGGELGYAERMTTRTPKRRLRAPARRKLIVDAALAECAEHGYNAASMGRIAAAAGVARTVLYDHFPSKRALFAALVEAKQADLLEHLRAALTAEVPRAERMRTTLDTFFRFAEDQPEAWRLLYPDHEPIEPEVAADHRRHRAAANRMLAEMLAPDARRAGLDPATPVAEAIFALHQAALHGVVRWWSAHPAVPREEIVAAAMHALWTGIEGLERRGAKRE